MSAPTPPFSLEEFGDLVALALDIDHADRFSESLLQFDPDFLAPSNTLSSPLSTKKNSPPELDSASPSSMRTTGTPSTSTWAVSTPSRPRQILDKIKRQASAFVMRVPEAEKPRSQAPPLQTIPTFSPYTGTRHASGSSFVDEDDEYEPAPFAPYIPLAAQYERAAAAAAAHPTLPGNKDRNLALSIFSRPPSDVTSPPPSPKSIRSISTTSSAAPVTPTTPLFAPRPSASSPDDAYNPRWSLCTDDSSPSSCSPSVSYQKHPFAHPHDEHDPFAKGSVQVVRHSGHSQDGYGYGHRYKQFPSPKRRHSTRRRRTAPAPARPPPSGPLPTLPLSTATASPATSSHSESENESGDGGSKECVHKPALVAPLQPAACLSVPDIFIQSSAKPKSKKKVLRIRVAPATAFSATPASKVQDWTLSLPLNVAFPGSPSSPSPSSTVSLHTPSQSPQQPRLRTRSHSFLSHSSSSSSDDHSSPSRCPSAWHPTPPKSAPLPLPAVPTIDHRSPSCSSIRSASSTGAPKHPHPPRTADSTTSTSSTNTNASSASTESTATIMPSAAQRQRERERGRALATLTGPPPSNINMGSGHEAEAEDETDNESILSCQTGPYYSARSSFGSSCRLSFGSAYGCRVRVRVKSAV